jgi:adhesin/invasin
MSNGMSRFQRSLNRQAIMKVAAAAIAFAWGCGDGTGPPPAVATVTLSATQALELVAGGTQTLSATAKSATGEVLTDRIATWSSSDQSKVSVAAGVVTGVAIGNATITVSIDGITASVAANVRDGLVVAPSGSAFTSQDGSIAIAVPSGAVAAPASLTVQPAANPVANPRLLPGTAFDLGSGATFTQPFNITIKYNPANVASDSPESGLQLYELIGTSWRVVDGSTVNLTSKTVTGSVNHPGTFAVLMQPRVETVTIGGDLSALPVVNTRQLTVAVKDNEGTTLNRAVTWLVSDPNIASISATGLLTPKIPGNITVTATSENKSGTAQISVVTGPPAKIVAVGGNNQSVLSGATVPVAPSVKVTDALDNPIANVPITFAVATGGGSVTGGSTTTNSSGIATVGSWTLGTAAGPNSLTVTSSAISGVSVTFQASGGVGPPTNLVPFAGNNQTGTAGGLIPTAPSVRVTDANGNVIPGFAVTFAPGSGSGTVTGGSTVTDATGLARPTSWRLGTTPGTQTLVATASGLSGSPFTFNATALAPVPSTIAGFAGNNQNARPGNAVFTPPSVIVKDPAGIPVPGATVTFTVTAGGGSVTGGTATTNADGIAAVGSWTLGPALGPNSLSASVAGVSTPVIFNATGAIPPATKILINDGNNQQVFAGQTVGTPPSVKVTDDAGIPAANVIITFAIGSGGGTITGPTATTNSSGIATVGSWTLGPVAGPNSLIATSPDLPGVSVTFQANGAVGPAAIITAFAGNNQTGTAGGLIPTPPSVKVTDANGNVVAGFTVTFTPGSGSGTVSGGSAVTDGSGIARPSSWRLGSTPSTQTLIATASGLSGSPVTFSATAVAPVASAITGFSGNNQTARPGTTVAATPTVIVTDPAGIPVPGVTVTFQVTAGGGSVTGATQVTNPDGLAAVGSWTLGLSQGPNSLMASIPGGIPAFTFNATSSTPPPVRIAINAGDNQTAIAGQAVAIPPSVKITDADGIGVGGVSVAFSIRSGGGTLTGENTVTNAQGIATVGSWTLGIGGNSIFATVAGLTGNPIVFVAFGEAEVQIVTFGDSNTDLGFAGTTAAAKVASYVSGASPAIKLSANAPNDATQLAGKIEIRWKQNRSKTIKAVNHGITGTSSGTGRSIVQSPNALESVGGVTRFRGEVLGDAYPWSGGEPQNEFYPTGAIPRVNAFKPRTSDFAYISIGTNDVADGSISTTTIANNLQIMIDEWIARGLTPSRLMITTLPPRRASENLGNKIADLNGKIRTLAAQKGVRLIDIAPLVSNDDGRTWKAASLHTDNDELHYSEAVRDQIADIVVSYMLQLIPP